ncbi:helix-turn-helix domain-containing protein [Acinetobacter dispersus]|uniref:helix-turn-helix domain-containing protein n=1 Tax=Acinetobacter dispersus TaxID=70348 RepID=UPI001358A445|nr:helix-turn-helix transcriptional regulator [Acinetobacter dispersus]
MDIENNDSIGSRLGKERLRFGFTQPELAEKLELDKQSVYRYENDKRMMKIDDLQKLLKLGFDVLYILSGQKSDSLAMLTPQEKDWLTLYSQTNLNQRDALFTVARSFAASFPASDIAD